jgi:hypothetical protein
MRPQKTAPSTWRLICTILNSVAPVGLLPMSLYDNANHQIWQFNTSVSHATGGTSVRGPSKKLAHVGHGKEKAAWLIHTF